MQLSSIRIFSQTNVGSRKKLCLAPPSTPPSLSILLLYTILSPHPQSAETSAASPNVNNTYFTIQA
jgi:hypothetical protein